MDSTDATQPMGLPKLGRYQIKRQLGSGGYADVYLAEDMHLHAPVVLKILKQRWMELTFVRSFEQEARAARALAGHPNIITIYDFGQEEGRFYISMDYAPGGSLEQELKQRGRFSPDEVAALVHQVASALDHAHTRQVIHRDVKPSNILIRDTSGGREHVVLADFGIAKAFQLQIDVSDRRTTTKAVGTGPYMAPEQILHPGEVDYRVDIYSLGVTIYQLLSGELPFQADNFLELTRKITESAPPPLSAGGIHPQIERVVFKAMAKEPGERYESAGALARALDEAVRVWQQETGERETLTTLGGMAAVAMDGKRWEDAARLWRRYLALSPDSSLAQTQLAIAEREMELRRLHDRIERGEAEGDWEGVIQAAQALLDINPEDRWAEQCLSNANEQKELYALYERANDAAKKGNLDEAIEYARRVLERAPNYRNTAVLLDDLVRKKVDRLKEQALLAIARRDRSAALGFLGDIQGTDPEHRFCSKETLDQIASSAQLLLEEEKKTGSQARSRRWWGIIIGIGVVVLVLGAITLCVVLGPLHDWLLGTGTPTAIVAYSPTATVTLAPTEMLSPTATSTATQNPTQSPTPTQTPIPSPTDTPLPVVPVADAVVGARGAELRPGCTRWWNPRVTLPAGTELDLGGQHSQQCPGWVYVRTKDGRHSGWTEQDRLTINRNVSSLPLMTPIPTLTATPVTPTSLPSGACEGGPLTLDAYPIGDKVCEPNGWRVTIYVRAHGGDCRYIYYWEGQQIGGPTSDAVNFEVFSAGYGSAIAGQVSVVSAGETVVKPVYVTHPTCP